MISDMQKTRPERAGPLAIRCCVASISSFGGGGLIGGDHLGWESRLDSGVEMKRKMRTDETGIRHIRDPLIYLVNMGKC